jgi:hypothetical protein
LKLTLNKSISATHLNQKTGVPYSEPEATIPFGAILTYKGSDRDAEKFTFLGELYRCPRDVLASALDGGKIPSEDGDDAPAAVITPAASHAAAKPAPEAALKFEKLSAGSYSIARAKVPGGWLLISGSGAPAFYPDPQHVWNGESL